MLRHFLSLNRVTLAFENICIPNRGIKRAVDINWVKPEKVPSYKPAKSGDLEGVPPISSDTYSLNYALSEELKDAPETVKKLFTIPYINGKHYHKAITESLISRVKRHGYDENTAETKIARLTGHIRYYQSIMEEFPRNKKLKVLLKETIDRRKKLLKFLRQYDYKKFEWLLEKLNIEYKGHPESHLKLTRKQSLRKLTEMHCEEVRNKKLNDYRNLLESQQGPFLKAKLEALKFIRKEQIELQLEITVKEQDIAKVEKQLEEWTVRDKLKQEERKKRKSFISEIET